MFKNSFAKARRTSLSVAFFGQGMCNLGWTLITDVAPRQLVGLTGGVFNLCANLAGIVTGGRFRGRYDRIFRLGAVIGVLSYIFVLGDVKRVEYEP